MEKTNKNKKEQTPMFWSKDKIRNQVNYLYKKLIR